MSDQTNETPTVKTVTDVAGELERMAAMCYAVSSAARNLRNQTQTLAFIGAIHPATGIILETGGGGDAPSVVLNFDTDEQAEAFYAAVTAIQALTTTPDE